MKDEKRFEAKYTQKTLSSTVEILKDTKTGVCYLFASQWQYGGGLTPLLDENGNVVIDK